jgi:hypothetical protein
VLAPRSGSGNLPRCLTAATNKKKECTMRTATTAASLPQIRQYVDQADWYEVMMVKTFSATEVVIWVEAVTNKYTVIELPQGGPVQMYRSTHPYIGMTFEKEEGDSEYYHWQEAVAYALSMCKTADGESIRYHDSMIEHYVAAEG